MSQPLISMAPVHLVDIVGSALMIVFASWSMGYAGALKRKEPQNVIWTYLQWFCLGLLVFSISRSVGHLIKYLLEATGQRQAWIALRPVTSSLNTLSFILVGAISLFFSRVYSLYQHMQQDQAALERAHGEIVELNVNLEKTVAERTRDLSASEEKYRRVFEGSKDMLFICDRRGTLLDVNRSGAELLGYGDPREIAGMNLFADFMRPAETGPLRRRLETGSDLQDVEVCLRKADGQEVVALLSATVGRSPAGEPSGFEGTVKDITLRKNMERQLLQADKLASLGQLSAGVAHEINNPLGLILGYTQLILKETDAHGQLHDDLKVIEKHAGNCKRIVEDLLKFSRSTATTKTRARLNELLEEVVQVVEAKFSLENVGIVKRLAADLPEVTVDPDKLRQVFMNLVMNARQAIQGAGTITVTSEADAANGQVLFSVRDTGCGIPSEIMHKIFDPFFTTKPTGMGTGLGLAVSYGIIQDHEGEIHAESTPGSGSTFHVRLPVAAPDPDAEAES